MPNWIPTRNPFGLATPPAWFLLDLAAYNPALVVFASVEEPLYRLGSRVRVSAPLLAGAARHPDLAICAAAKLHPVKSFFPPAISADLGWGRIIPDLHAYSVDAVGGVEAAADRLDGFDDAEEAKNRAETEDGLRLIAAETYGPVKRMAGEGVALSRLGRRPKPSYARSRMGRDNTVTAGAPTRRVAGWAA